MSNVIDLFTGQLVKIETNYNANYSEAINQLAQRFDTNCESVCLEPTIKSSNGILSIRTYKGNVYTGKINHGKTDINMPLPVNDTKYWDEIRNSNKIDTLILEDECFMYMDRKYKQTLQFIQDLLHLVSSGQVKNIESIIIRTRSDLFAHDQYLDILEQLQRQGISIEFKLYGMNISEAENKRKWPGAPSVKRRQKALNKALDRLKLILKAL